MAEEPRQRRASSQLLAWVVLCFVALLLFLSPRTERDAANGGHAFVATADLSRRSALLGPAAAAAVALLSGRGASAEQQQLPSTDAVVQDLEGILRESALSEDCACCKTDWCGCDSCSDCYAFLQRSGTALPADAQTAYAQKGDAWATSLAWSSTLGNLPGGSSSAGPGGLAVRQSKLEGAGQGLFSEVGLPANAVLPPYQGKVLSYKEGKGGGDYVWCPVQAGVFFELAGDATVNGTLANLPSYCVDSSSATQENPSRFVNGALRKEQCSQVNLKMCELGSVMYMRTVKPVPAGAELVVDYGDFFVNGETC